MANNIQITDNSQLVLNEMGRKLQNALWSIGAIAEKYAKENLTDAGRVDTGELRNSVSHVADIPSQSAYIGTNVEYAPYIEYGTGIYTDPPFIGRRSPWMVVPDGSGKYKEPFWTYGIKPCHFLRNAVADNEDKYEQILRTALKN